MQNTKEVIQIISNCKNEDELLQILKTVNEFQKDYSLLDLNFINIAANHKIETLKN